MCRVIFNRYKNYVYYVICWDFSNYLNFIKFKFLNYF